MAKAIPARLSPIVGYALGGGAKQSFRRNSSTAILIETRVAAGMEVRPAPYSELLAQPGRPIPRKRSTSRTVTF